MSSLCAAALRWARRSPVFPCNQMKRPLTPRGFYDASVDPAMIVAWWKRWPEALIAIPTGERSGLVVLDLDSPQGHKADGLASFAVLLAGRDLTAHPIIRTRSGGEHHYFSNQNERQIRNQAGKLAPGLDQRGEGGYVVVPPSPGYERLNRIWPAPAPPGWLLDLMAPPATPYRRSLAQVGVPRPMRDFATLIRFAASSTEGERNHRAYWAACRLGEASACGHIGEAAAVTLIAEAAQAAGLPAREAVATATSGVRRGMGSRR